MELLGSAGYLLDPLLEHRLAASFLQRHGINRSWSYMGTPSSSSTVNVLYSLMAYQGLESGSLSTKFNTSITISAVPNLLSTGTHLKKKASG